MDERATAPMNAGDAGSINGVRRAARQVRWRPSDLAWLASATAVHAEHDDA